VTTSVVVRGILLAADQKLWVKKLAVFTSADLIDWGWVKIDEEGSWNIFAGAGLAEESVVGAALTEVLGVWVRTSIWEKAVFEEVTEAKISIKSGRIQTWALLTAPKQRYQAEYQPGQCGVEESKCKQKHQITVQLRAQWPTMRPKLHPILQRRSIDASRTIAIVSAHSIRLKKLTSPLMIAVCRVRGKVNRLKLSAQMLARVAANVRIVEADTDATMLRGIGDRVEELADLRNLGRLLRCCW
jgi:hypothetical protein